MFKIFRENKQSLPGDEEIIKNQKPSIKIVLQPMSTEDLTLRLPKLELSQVILQPNMIVESLKKYLKTKFDDFNYEEISIFYKNIEMPDHYTIKDIERIYSFSGEKTIFYYTRKNNNSHNRFINNTIMVNMNSINNIEENSTAAAGKITNDGMMNIEINTQ